MNKSNFGKYILAVCYLLTQISGFSQDPNFYIYLAFGQSNMEGQGAIEAIDQTVDARFMVMQSLDCPELDKMKGNWYSAVPPICQCHSGLGPADYFGRTMVDNLPDSIRVGVITIAVGGCDIRLFDKDRYEDHDSTYQEDWFTNKVAAYGGNPYQRLLEMAQLAKKDGIIKGILLHQGETNTGDQEWPNYVTKIYKDLLGDLSLEPQQIPLLAGETVSVEGSCCASMNTIINQLPDVLENAHIISSENCTAQDNAHFDAAGYREMGRRYANKMLYLMLLK